MTEFQIYLCIMAVLITCGSIYRYRSKRYDNPARIVEDQGQYVLFWQTPLARITQLFGKTIPKYKIGKIERAKDSVTLYTTYGKNYKIQLAERQVEVVSRNLKFMIAHAQYVVIE